jgi:hypothetical protein
VGTNWQAALEPITRGNLATPLTAQPPIMGFRNGFTRSMARDPKYR